MLPQATAAGNSRRQQPQATAFFFILTFFFALNSCQKTETPISQSNEVDATASAPVESRDLELTDVAKYYVDNVETTKSNYDNQSPSLWFHDVVSKEGNDRVTKSYAFSTKAIYETWGNTVGIPVTKLNQFDDRVDALIIKYGIAPIVESGATPSTSVTDSYLAEVKTAYDDLFPPAQIASMNGLYAGSTFWSNNCTPGSDGCYNAPAYFLPTYLSMPSWISTIAWSWMQSNAQGWEPQGTANNSEFKVTLRPHPYILYITPFWMQWKKKTTVKVNGSSLFVPFQNGLQIWSNRISSWNIFPHVN